MSIPEIILKTTEVGIHRYDGITHGIDWGEWEDRFLANGIVFIRRSSFKGIEWRKYPYHLTKKEVEIMKSYESLRNELDARNHEAIKLNELFVPEEPEDLKIEKEPNLVSYLFSLSNTDISVEIDNDNGNCEIGFTTLGNNGFMDTRMKRIFYTSMKLFNIIIWCVMDYASKNHVKEFDLVPPNDDHEQERRQVYGNILERPEVIGFLSRHNLKPEVIRKNDNSKHSMKTVLSAKIIS